MMKFVFAILVLLAMFMEGNAKSKVRHAIHKNQRRLLKTAVLHQDEPLQSDQPSVGFKFPVEVDMTEFASEVKETLTSLKHGLVRANNNITANSDRISFVEAKTEHNEIEIDNIIEGLNSTDLKKEIKSLQADNKVIHCRLQDIDPRTITYTGTPGASSEYNEAHGAKSAFKRQSSGDKPYANAKGGLPLTVWYQFNKPQVVSKISLRSRNDVYDQAEQAPEDLTFKGSDDCLSWVPLKTVAHAGFTTKDDLKVFKIPCSARRAYRCYGIESSQSHGGGEYVSLQDVIMYG